MDKRYTKLSKQLNLKTQEEVDHFALTLLEQCLYLHDERKLRVCAVDEEGDIILEIVLHDNDNEQECEPLRVADDGDKEI